MIDRRWMVDDAFGRQWRLWIASRGETSGMRDDRARTAIRGLVWASANAGHDRYDRASAMLLEIHAELTGGSLSRHERDPASLGSARLMWERISEALEHATAAGRLRIEPAMRFQPTFVLEDAPDTLRDLDAPPPSLPGVQLADWVGIELVDASGRPLAGRRYRIELPDGGIREGGLDDHGIATITRTESGTCRIECPFHPPTAATTHVVAQGEHAPGIAARYGFDDFHEIWDHPDNADLRALRPSPTVLAPGDELHVPARTSESTTRATGAQHRFVSKEAPLKLRLRLQDFLGRPLRDASFDFVTRDTKESLTTDGDGHFEAEIAKTDRDKRLLLDDFTMPLQIGSLDPIQEESGRNARLANLGYLLDPTDSSDDDDVHLAVEEFQADNDLPLTGTFDSATQAKLLEVHGC